MPLDLPELQANISRLGLQWRAGETIHSDHSELWGRLLGDTADRIADHAQCSVLIVKR